MSKKEYLEALQKELSGYGAEICEEIMGEFEAHFAEAGEAGLTDEEIIAQLGTIQEVSESIKGMYGAPGATDTIDELARAQEEYVNAQIEYAKKISMEENDYWMAQAQMGDLEIVSNKRKEVGAENENGIVKGSILQEVSTIEIEGDLDLKLMHGEGDGFWEFHKRESNFFGSLFWKQFWGARNVSHSGADIEVERNGNILHFSLPDGASGDLKIEVPKYVRTIRAHGKDSDIEVMDLNLDEFLSRVYSGDLKFNSCHFTTADIHTSSGDIECNRLFGDIKLQSNAGDIEVEDHQGPGLDLMSMAGDIEATTTSPVVSVKTQAGDIELEMHGPVIDVQVETQAGDVEFKSESKDYTANIKTSAGDLSNKSGLTNRGKGSGVVGGSWIIGEGSGIVNISTSAGDIKIR